MKITYRIPTQDQYAFVEVEQELKDEAFVNAKMPSALKEAYDDFTNAFKRQHGIDEKEMNKVIDCMLTNQTINGGNELYEQMSQTQRYAVQTLKRGLKRQDYKEGEFNGALTE